MNAVSRLTAKELNLAARTVFAEAATEGLNGQMAVAQTMYYQLHHNIIGADGSGFGKTLEEVIKNAYTTPTNQDIRGSSCLEAVIRVFLEGQRIFTDHYVYFFMSDRGSSYWRNYWDTHYVNMGKLKNHTFWGVQFQMMRKHSRLPAMWHQWMIQTDGHLCMKKPEVTRNF